MTRALLFGIALLAPTTAGVALAQTRTASLQPVVDQQVASQTATQKAAEQRIETLRKQLGITPDQTALWDAFAQAMRDNATATDQLFQRRASTVASMNAVDNMRSYADIAREYAANTDRLATAFASLYASLSDLQKQAADSLFRQQSVAAAQPRR